MYPPTVSIFEERGTIPLALSFFNACFWPCVLPVVCSPTSNAVASFLRSKVFTEHTVLLQRCVDVKWLRSQLAALIPPASMLPAWPSGGELRNCLDRTEAFGVVATKSGDL